MGYFFHRRALLKEFFKRDLKLKGMHGWQSAMGGIAVAR